MNEMLIDMAQFYGCKPSDLLVDSEAFTLDLELYLYHAEMSAKK